MYKEFLLCKKICGELLQLKVEEFKIKKGS